MVRLSDYVIEFLAKQGIKYIFMVSGGGGMFLIDSLGRNRKIQYVCNHHEQACVMAAEGYQRVTGNIGAALVTTGPAGTNTLTGVLCAWNDSIPLIVISGQTNSRFLIGNSGLRQRGAHEANISRIMESVTKYAVTVMDAGSIRYHLEKAVYEARNERPGPVWLDIPLDIQSSLIQASKLKGFIPPRKKAKTPSSALISDIKKVAAKLQRSIRPVILAGHGIRLGVAQREFLDFIEKYQIPVVTTKNALDLIYDSHNLLAGRVGTYGQRAANFAVQNSDLVICLGTRLTFHTTGYDTQNFAREAEKVLVDIDQNQLDHALVKIKWKFNLEVKDFLGYLGKVLGDRKLLTTSWIAKCHHWRKTYPPVDPAWKIKKKYVNSYYFFKTLSAELTGRDVVVTDQGAAFYSATPAFKVKKGQRVFTNGGFSPMGYGLPAAIGACYGHNKKRVICVHGDGGLQMNIQELQTIVHNDLPIKLFVFDNQGYLSIKHTQQAYFSGFLVGCDPASGISCPDTLKIARAYGIKSFKISNHQELGRIIRQAISTSGPVIVEVKLDPLQPFNPRVSSERKKDGRMVSKPLEDMYPFLSREEFGREMIIKPVAE